MAKKKNNFYAVKVGIKPGIYETWELCKAQVHGYPGSLYKGFQTKREAQAYLDGKEINKPDKQNKNSAESLADVTVYVDGSYDESKGVYGYGCVVLLRTGDTKMFNGAGNNPESAELRNVTGEMLGAMSAVRFAINNGFKSVKICYDYYGIEYWATKKWKANTDLTRKYADFMIKCGRSIDISFKKVAAHTNVKYNEMADRLAKEAVKKK